MKHQIFLSFIVSLVAIAVIGCASAPDVVQEPVDPPVADFGDAWSAAAVLVEQTGGHGLSKGMAQAVFSSLWTAGESAGNVYPKEFVSVVTGETVEMELLWDDGGNIAAGVYDVRVDVDGRPREGWLRNVDISGSQALEITVNFNASQFAVSLDEVQQIAAFPSGTYAEYSGKNMLDSVPAEKVLTIYDEYNGGIWAVVPAGVVDLRVVLADGTVEWLEGYELPSNTRILEL